MFDTVFGLPLHVLLVHAVVVLLPLAAVLTAAWPLLRRRLGWRRPERVGWLLVAADAVLTVLAWVTVQAGEALQRRLGGEAAVEHGNMGRLLPWFALALTLVAGLTEWLHRRSASAGVPAGSGMPNGATVRIGALVVLLVALGTVVWTVRTGHSGSTAVWSEIVKNTGK